jgi:hypothetical protein
MPWAPRTSEEGGTLKIRVVRGCVVAFFILFALFVTWPGMLPFNRIRPSILGLPLSMAWIAGWVILSFVALVVLDRAEANERRRREE